MKGYVQWNSVLRLESVPLPAGFESGTARLEDQR